MFILVSGCTMTDRDRVPRMRAQRQQTVRNHPDGKKYSTLLANNELLPVSFCQREEIKVTLEFKCCI